MARTNLHELASKLLGSLQAQAADGTFEGKLRAVAAEAGLNSVRSAEVVKLLEELDRIEVVQRGRRGRETVIKIRSDEPVALDEVEARLPSRTARRAGRLNYDDLGKSVIDRLLELARDDGLRAAQVEAFAGEAKTLRERVRELEAGRDAADQRETELRVRLRAAQEALTRAEENLRKLVDSSPRGAEQAPVPDDEARAVLDVLRSGLP